MSVNVSAICQQVSSNVSDGSANGEDITFTFVIYVLIFGVLCAFGLVGNTLSFLVLQWQRGGDVGDHHAAAANFLLKMIAIVDNLFLLATGFAQIFNALVLFSGKSHPLTPYMSMYVWPLVHITQMWTVWSTVLIAANRYVAICRPFQAPSICSLTCVRMQSAIVAVAIVLYSIPRFLEFTIYTCQSEDNSTWVVGAETALKKNGSYRIIYENILYCLFIFLSPLLILAILNVRLALELCAIKRRLTQRHLPEAASNGDEGHNLTLVTMVIVMTFIVCQTPAFVNMMLYYWLPEGSNYASRGTYYYYYHISNLLISANSCVNFVIYCAFRRQFRHRLRLFCLRQRRLLPGYHPPHEQYHKNMSMSTYEHNNTTIAHHR